MTTQTVISQFCNPALVGATSIVVVLLALVIIIQQIIIAKLQNRRVRK